MPSVLFIQHTPTGGPRRVATWLEEAGVDVAVVKGFEGMPSEVPAHDGLIVLGGGYLPDADDRAPWLAPTRDLVEQALKAEIPVLGICLGGQMLAHVAGGAVAGDVGAPEKGSTPVTMRSETSQDPLFHGFPQTVAAMEHHIDAITELPAGATWLAETERCPYQAFRVGPAAWGLQFHPEVLPETILNWNSDVLAEQGFDRDELYRRAVADEPTSTPVWRTLIDRFAEQVHKTAA